MRPPNDQQDRFFLWGIVLLPILSLAAYIFDAFYHYESLYRNSSPIYEGLLSTILMIFAYLQYCAPIESRHLRLAYHLLLWILVEIGHVGYLLSFIHLGNLFSVMIFVGWMICDLLFTAALLYCRVYRELDPHIEVENKHIFHFLSRLEVILAIFIPVFINPEYSTITRDNIAFFLLFDFFSEKYERFSGIWIKSCLYLFVATVTASVASEWLYFTFKNHTFEYITDISELVSACFCYILIIMQFFEFNFKSHSSQDIPEKLDISIIDSKPVADVY
jgi:hypothetical protein